MKLAAISVVVFLMGFASTGGTRLPEEGDLQICSLPLHDNDVCRAAHPGYRFNLEKKRCEAYRYGCKTSKNHFTTREDCERKCGKHFGEDPCNLPKNEGYRCTSENPYTYYWFNQLTERCELFQHQGCGGNGNNFLEARECWEVCGHRVSDPCKFPISIGHHCKNDTRFVSRQEVFGYNYATHRCERFTYLGCGGYTNRFNTAAECWKKCAGASGSKCVLEIVKRKWGAFSKYYYNMTSNTCEHSRYWTNRVNGKNRFSSLAECERNCKDTCVPNDIRLSGG